MRGDHPDTNGNRNERRDTAWYRQRTLEPTAFLRTDHFARASRRRSPVAVRHSWATYRDYADDCGAAPGVGKFSYSEIYRNTSKYRASGGDDWDSLLGLVVGSDGVVVGGAVDSVGQAGGGSASIDESRFEHVGADTAEKFALGAVWRIRVGTRGSLFAASAAVKSQRSESRTESMYGNSQSVPLCTVKR